jgi:hypothetical protein
MTIVAERGFVSWGTTNDHVIAFFGRTLTIAGTTNIRIRAGNVRLDAQIRAPRDAVVSVDAHDDASVNGGSRLKGAASRFKASSDEGSVFVGPGTSWRAGHLNFIAFGPDMGGKRVVIGDGVRLAQLGDDLQFENLTVEGVEGVELWNLRARSRGSIRIVSFGGIVAHGRTELHAVRGDILFHGDFGILHADQLAARAAGEIQVSASEVELYAPPNAPARLQVGDRENGVIRIGGFDVSATGLRAEAPRFDISAGVIDLREARIRSRGSAPGVLELSTVDAICDLTGAHLVNVMLIHQCRSLAGPDSTRAGGDHSVWRVATRFAVSPSIFE